MKQDQFVGLILIIFSGFMYYQASQLPPAMFGALGADIFPKILFALLALFGATLLIQSFWKVRKETLASQQEPDRDKTLSVTTEPKGVAYYKYVIIGFASFMVYVILMYYLGYLISTLFFLPVLMWILGPKTKTAAITIVLVSLGLTIGMQVVFARLLKVFLPEGAFF